MRRAVAPVSILLLYTVGFDLTLLAQVRSFGPPRPSRPHGHGPPFPSSLRPLRPRS
jgi:hypothetical protein